MHNYRKLEVWKKSRAAVLQTYEITRRFPKEERFGIVLQFRRAALSVVLNIVEGSKRESPREFAHFLNISEGSAAECQELSELGCDLKLMDEAPLRNLALLFTEIEKMLFALRRSL